MIKHLFRTVVIAGCLSVGGLWGQIPSDCTCTGINLADLRERNFSNTADLLGYLPGIDVRSIGIPGQWTALSIRGQDLNRTTLLLDGIPIRDPWTGFADLNWIPEEWIDSVRVCPAVNRASAFPGSTVSLLTAGKDAKHPYTRFAYLKGNQDFSDLDVSFIEPLGEKLKIISGMSRDLYGSQIADRASDLTTLRAKILCQPCKNGTIAYTVLSNKHELNHPYRSSFPGADTLYDSMTRSTRRTDHALQITGSAMNIMNELTLHYASLDYAYRVQNQSRHFPVHTVDAQILQRSDRFIIPLSWGLALTRNELNTPETGRVHQMITAGFVQGEIALGTRWTVSPRISPVFSDYGNHWTGALHASYRPVPSFTGWFQAANGVQTPSLGERTGRIHQPFPYARNSAFDVRSLRNELNRIIEAGVEWHFHKTLGMAFRAYGNWIQNTITADLSAQPVSIVNDGKNRFLGTEWQANWEPFTGLRTNLVLNTMNSQDEGGSALLNNPTLWGNASLTGECRLFQGDLKLILYIGLRFSNTFWTPGAEGSPVLIPSRELFDVKFTAVMMQHARLFISMDNVAGSRAYLLYGFAFPAKTVHTGLVWELNN